MKSTNSYTEQQIEKLGNALVYLATNVGEFNKTKALKLLFLLEEKSIKSFGVPFFGFDFKVWQFGPVVPLVYNDFQKGLKILGKYIKKVDPNIDEYEAVSEFCDDEFSDNDICLLQDVVQFSKHKTAKNLVDFTHKKGSLWHYSVFENKLQERFNTGLTTTDISINFSSLVEENQYLTDRYQSSMEYIEFNKSLKS